MEISKQIPVICGPTGSGKTAVALNIAKELPVEIVSADSRQMIRYLDIGTAKPTKAEQKQVKFHLINNIEPGEVYSAFKFISDADNAIRKILASDMLPLVVGGTGLYLKALTDGIFDIESDNSEIRVQLEDEIEKLGAEKLYNELKKVDPEEAARFHPNNKIRIIRALEIFRLTGKTKSELTKTASYKKSDFTFKIFCLMPPREQLYKAIELRVDQMLQNGLFQELKDLIAEGLREPVQKMNVIGYSELLEHINGNCTYEEAVLLIKQNTRRFAKRQVTWFRHQIDCENFSAFGDLERAFCKNYAGIAR